jgi:purine-nucleoside phosphorylase
MLGFSGYYQNKKITVMGHGMGMPSVGIYSYELFKFYKVHTIIRAGSCGGMVKNVKVGDVVITQDAFSNSIYAQEVGAIVHNKILPSDPMLLALVLKIANAKHIPFCLGRIYSEDAFYSKFTLAQRVKESGGAIAAEMEAFALYANAQILRKHAITLLTCSDSMITHQAMSSAQRQTSFTKMVELALATAVAIKIKD